MIRRIPNGEQQVCECSHFPTPKNVVAGKKVNLAGFGSFQLRARAARKGRNPQTGEEIDIKASNSPGFSAAKAFKDLANE